MVVLINQCILINDAPLINKIAEPSACARKYLIEASISIAFSLFSINGTKQSIFNSIEAHNIKIFVEEIAIIDDINIKIIIASFIRSWQGRYMIRSHFIMI